MDKRYQIVSPTDTDALPDSQAVAGLLAQEGQLILPVLDLIEQAQVAIDEVVDVMGRATIEAVLQMSAAQLAGPKQQGKKAEREIVYHGTQKGRVALKERQLHVTKPRLRKRKGADGESGEVEVPAYAALQKDGRLADRMLQIMMAGVSTRRYEEVLPEMAQTVGRHGRIVLPPCSRGQARMRLVTEPEQTSRAGPRARSPGSSSRRASGCSRNWPNGTSPRRTSSWSPSTGCNSARTT